ncbi:MAG: peptidoglycan-associated lipoprotein Pal [Thiohalomonadales bacterium]
MNHILKLILLGVFAVTLISCSSNTKKDDSADNDSASGETRQDADQGTDISQHPLDAKTGLLAKRVIYFEFNQATISDEDREFISAHAKYLSENNSDSVVLEGHADERGTREYNISLGERRAKAVMELLVLQGAGKSQIQVISFGEERPVALGHDESSWSQNRRVELVYAGH